MSIPSSTKYLIIGAGIHGLSTAWHLAMELGDGKDILVVDKRAPGAGATGIACGCVRNFYMTEAMHPILRHSVDVWNYDPVALGFQQVGYVSCGEENQRERVFQDAEEPRARRLSVRSPTKARKLTPFLRASGLTFIRTPQEWCCTKRSAVTLALSRRSMAW